MSLVRDGREGRLHFIGAVAYLECSVAIDPRLLSLQPLDCPIEGVTERLLPWISSERRTHLAGHIGEADLFDRVGKTNRSSGSWCSKRLFATAKVDDRPGLHESE